MDGMLATWTDRSVPGDNNIEYIDGGSSCFMDGPFFSFLFFFEKNHIYRVILGTGFVHVVISTDFVFLSCPLLGEIFLSQIV